MAITKETIEQVRKMPHMLGRFRNEIMGQDTDKTEAAINAILLEENYSLSERQQEVFASGVPVFNRDKEAVEYALSLGNNYRLKEELSKNHKIKIYDIDGLTFHPTSITFALENRIFRDVWDRRNGSASGVFPVGFTNNDFLIQVDQHKVRYSFRDRDRSDFRTAQHENQHVLYCYTHPFCLKWKVLSKEKITKLSNKIWSEGDLRKFQTAIDELSFFQMYRYLDEVTATSLKRGGVLDQFIGDEEETYGEEHQKRLNALRSGLAKDSFEYLIWERVIWDKEKALDHKMKFVETEYKNLLISGLSTEEITNILQVLTPDQAYLIRVFNPQNQNITISDIYKWAREYFNGWKPKTPEDKHGDLTEFLVETADSENMDLRELTSYNGPEIDLESIIGTIKGFIIPRATQIKVIYESYIDQLPLTQSEKETVKVRLLRQSLNFNELFYQFIVGHDFKINQDSDSVILSALTKRALELDDAMEDMMEAYKNGQDVDFDKLFTPGYRRSDEVYKRKLQLLSTYPLLNLAYPIDSKSALKISSNLIRVLLFAKEQKTDDQIDLSGIRDYLLEMRKQKTLPSIFEPLVKAFALLSEKTDANT